MLAGRTGRTGHSTKGTPGEDVVPLQPTNICDNGLAALRHFGQIHGNIVQKATTFFRTILAFTVQIIVQEPAKTEATSDTYTVKRTALSTVTSRAHNNINIKHHHIIIIINVNKSGRQQVATSNRTCHRAFSSWI